MSSVHKEEMMQLTIVHLHGIPFKLEVPRNITVSGLKSAVASHLAQEYALEVPVQNIELRVKLSRHLPGRELDDEDNEHFENLARTFGVLDRGVVFLRFRKAEGTSGCGVPASHALPTSMRHESLGITTPLDANTAAALAGAGVSATINTRPPSATARKSSRYGWDQQAVEDLVDGATTFGVGKWRDILHHHEYSFPCSKDLKGQVVLKDKWRNLVKLARYESTPRSSTVVSPEILDRIRALL